VNTNITISVQTEGETATVFASDYLNKLSGEIIERECKRQLEAGCKTLVVNFAETEIVNSIGVSILLGVIDAASNADASVVFSDVNDETIELFEMLGLTNHVTVMSQESRVESQNTDSSLYSRLLTLDS
jgi:anti-anti-sigma factor